MFILICVGAIEVVGDGEMLGSGETVVVGSTIAVAVGDGAGPYPQHEIFFVTTIEIFGSKLPVFIA